MDTESKNANGFAFDTPENFGSEIYYNLPESTLRLIKTALEAGLEHARTALREHDRSLGRTTRKNQLWAKVLTLDVYNLEESLSRLPVSVERLD